MKVDVLLGLQWGDEGKGKVVDVLTPNYDIVARFHALSGGQTSAEGRTSFLSDPTLYDRKQQSFLVPKADIVANDYDLSINKYKEVERVKVTYDEPEVVFARLENLQNQVAGAMAEYKTMK